LFNNILFAVKIFVSLGVFWPIRRSTMDSVWPH